MGNWRTVQVEGSMTAADAAKLTELLDIGADYDWPHWGGAFGCLSFSSSRPGLCGLGAWPAEKISRSGNLAERDYSVQDVHKALEALICIAPSMLLKVHCGGDYESEDCVATISVGEGLVVTGKPEIEKVAGASEAQVLANLRANLARGH